MPGASIYITPRSFNLDEDIPARGYSVPMVGERVAYGAAMGIEYNAYRTPDSRATSLIFRLKGPGSSSPSLQGTADHCSSCKADCKAGHHNRARPV